MNTSAQNEAINAVLQLARKIGHYRMIFEASSELNPMDTSHLDKIALQACIDAAVELGYDGEGDIAHRLEEGDPKRYVGPIVKLVSVSVILSLMLMELPFRFRTGCLRIEPKSRRAFCQCSRWYSESIPLIKKK